MRKKDIQTILSHRYDQGADYWTTSDKRLIKGAPFSTLESAHYLLDLGMKSDDLILEEVSKLFFSVWQKDGRFKVYPNGGIVCCQTILSLNLLCYLGYTLDSRIQCTFQHLLQTQSLDGGWKCNKYSFGRGPETEFSNPHPTLIALDAFRHTSYLNQEQALDRAVEFLLQHWVIRKPIGPCHYGIGTLFMQVEYPFRNYNLFVYVYVLSFYKKARQDPRFLEALAVLQSKCKDGKIVIERVVPKLRKLTFCQQNETSELATKRYEEIMKNLR